jgi:hypothetical protein
MRREVEGAQRRPRREQSPAPGLALLESKAIKALKAIGFSRSLSRRRRRRDVVGQ